jgi:hypothetical protein
VLYFQSLKELLYKILIIPKEEGKKKNLTLIVMNSDRKILYEVTINNVTNKNYVSSDRIQ